MVRNEKPKPSLRVLIEYIVPVEDVNMSDVIAQLQETGSAKVIEASVINETTKGESRE